MEDDGRRLIQPAWELLFLCLISGFCFLLKLEYRELAHILGRSHFWQDVIVVD